MRDIVRIRLTGVSPLVMRGPGGSAVEAGKGRIDDPWRGPDESQWADALWLDRGRLCLPAAVLFDALADAAKLRKMAPAFRDGISLSASAPLRHDGPTSIDELWAEERFRMRSAVCVGRLRHEWRCLPRFERWSAEATVTIDEGRLARPELLKLFETAGSVFGIGAGRPRYGRFSAAETGERA